MLIELLQRYRIQGVLDIAVVGVSQSWHLNFVSSHMRGEENCYDERELGPFGEQSC